MQMSWEQAGGLALGALEERRGAWQSVRRGGEGYEMGAEELGRGSWEFSRWGALQTILPRDSDVIGLRWGPGHSVFQKLPKGFYRAPRRDR